MADDVELNAMSGGSIVAADEVAGKKYQRVKLIKGADGVNDGDISDANPWPVNVLALPALPAGDNNIGNIDVVSSALPAGAATSAKQDTEAALLSTIAGAVTNPLAVTGSFYQATQPVSIAAAVPVTDGGGSLTVDGNVGITGSVAVTGSFYQATQPVSLASLPTLPAGTNNIGDVDVLSLPTLPAGDNNIGNVDIVTMPNVTIGTLPALPAGTNNIGDVDVLSLPALPAGDNNIGNVDIVSSALPTGAATEAKQDAANALLTTIDADTSILVASQQVHDAVYATGQPLQMAGGVRRDSDTTPISNDGDVHPLTFDETGRLKVATFPGSAPSTTGNITGNGQSVSMDVSRYSNLTVHCTGTFSTVNCTFEGSIDGGTTWFATQGVRTNANTVELTTGNLSAAPAYGWELSVNALTNFRVRATAWTSGTQTWRFSPGTYATEPIPAIQTHAVTGSGTFTISGAVTMAANATTTPAKAQDGVAGGTDTGIPPLFVRRDTPTALTPIAGDYAFGQVSANGEQWVRQNTQPARVRTTDAIAVAQQTDVLMNGLTALTPKFAKVSAAASGDNTLVAFVSSKKIRIISLFLMSTGTVNAYIRDDAASPIDLIGDATNKLTLTAGAGFVLPPNPLGWAETTSGEGLQLNLSAAIGVAGCITYVEV